MRFLVPLLDVIGIVVHLYILILIAMVAMSWLVQFNILNTRQRFVYLLMDALYRLTNPLLRPIRRLIPAIGGIDVSPFILGLVLILIYNELNVLEFELAAS